MSDLFDAVSSIMCRAVTEKWPAARLRQACRSMLEDGHDPDDLMNALGRVMVSAGIDPEEVSAMYQTQADRVLVITAGEDPETFAAKVNTQLRNTLRTGDGGNG